MSKTVIIDCFPGSALRYAQGYAVIVIDVIRATTTAVTAVAAGRRCFPVSTVEGALARAAKLNEPLLVGELGGNMPYGFDLTNSPAEIARRTDFYRPMVLLSSSGTQLICNTSKCDIGLVACLRNYKASAQYCLDRYDHVAVIGAGTRNEFREEDQICCAWIAEILVDFGYTPENRETAQMIKRWRGVSPDTCKVSKSVAYLQKTDQLRDFAFILSHVNDVSSTFIAIGGQDIIEVPVPQQSTVSILHHDVMNGSN